MANDNGTHHCDVCGVVIDPDHCGTIHGMWPNWDRFVDEQLCDDCTPGYGETIVWLVERRRRLDAKRESSQHERNGAQHEASPGNTAEEGLSTMSPTRVHGVLRGPDLPTRKGGWQIYGRDGLITHVQDRGMGLLMALDVLSVEGWTLVGANHDGGWILTHPKWPK
jgi:hypothetical protein